MFYITRNGDGYFKGKIQALSGSFKGEITATSGKIQKGCKIGSWKVGDTKNTGRDGWLSCNSSFNNGVIDSGISWFIDDSEHFYNYGTIMNGVSFEYYSYGLKPESTILKFRFNSYSNAVNNANKNCMYADVGYIRLKSSGNVNLSASEKIILASDDKIELGHSNSNGRYTDFTINADGSIDINNNELRTRSIILQYPTNDFIYGYNTKKTLALKIAGITHYTDGGHTTDFGNTLIGTNIYGTQIHLRADNGIYQGDSTIITSDKRMKKDISLFDERYENFFMSISPSIYKFINGTSDRYHSGFISQEIEKSLTDSGLTTKDFAGFIRYNDPETNEEKYALRYEEFIALNTHMIQKLYKRIDELEKKLESK